MNIRESLEALEEQYLSPFASFSNRTRGRARLEPLCDIRPEYQRDRDRILHCKSFRRLKHKTQVFLAPEGDHYRTRLTHTLEVSQIARTIAKSLRLNESLTEAIALGHDLGHTPFGHAGERSLAALNPAGFAHNVQSLRVVDVLENDGRGLNLTFEVRDGILNHKKGGRPATLEGCAVSIADRIAYVNHDIEDAIRAGLLKEEDLPADEIAVLGRSTRERINTMITSIYEHSAHQQQRQEHRHDGRARGGGVGEPARIHVQKRVHNGAVEEGGGARKSHARRHVRVFHVACGQTPRLLPDACGAVSARAGRLRLFIVHDGQVRRCGVQ